MNIFENVLYNITRTYIKKYLTNNLGKVIEDDKKITCYVKKNNVKKGKYNYTIACFGIRKEKEKFAKVFKLNKPICYVIDGIDLKKHKTFIFGYNNCDIIIKNCNFGLDVSINTDGKCTIDNTNITTFSYLLISANNLIIKNMDSNQIKSISPKSNIVFSSSNKIDVIDSTIGSQKEDINISFLTSNMLNVVNSNIVGKQIECKSSAIIIDEKSSLAAIDKVDLQTDDFNSMNIDAPTIILNGNKISNKNKSIVLKKVTDPLSLKRLELVNILKQIRAQCESINSKKILEYQEELAIQPVSKNLKK